MDDHIARQVQEILSEVSQARSAVKGLTDYKGKPLQDTIAELEQN